MPDSSVSGIPGIEGAALGHPRSAKIIHTKNEALASSALPEPSHAAIAPAKAGPTARATLNATAASATARGRSARGTRSFTSACCAGM